MPNLEPGQEGPVLETEAAHIEHRLVCQYTKEKRVHFVSQLVVRQREPVLHWVQTFEEAHHVSLTCNLRAVYQGGVRFICTLNIVQNDPVCSEPSLTEQPCSM